MEYETESDTLSESEESKDDPVSQPLNIVIVSGGFDGLDGEIGGEEPSNEIGDRGREAVDRVKDSEQNDTTKEGVALGDLSTLLEAVENWVLGELCVGRGRVSQRGLSSDGYT